ncbi:copper amine oxidase N-terminal domain-containing protein [Paenibacillus sp. P26]|nr:copper amine oxidase N-terminal domain-containing protein [Paenibacillus sp. P26]
MKAVFSDKLYLKADYYVDGDFSIRKSDVEFGLTLPEGKGNGLKGFKITSSSEAWNINKPVTIATIDTSNGVYDLNETNGRMTAGRFLAGIDPNSQLYKLLKDDLHVTKKEINMFMSDKEDLGLYSPGSEPYNDNGTVMVPARFVTERLDADVSWDAAAKQVTIIDPLSGNKLRLTIGSTDASVNGQTVKLEKPVALVNGTTYVPVRFVTESFGAKVQWDGELQMVTITRD